MSDRVLTEQVRKLVLGQGMDLVGFGPVERWKNAPFLLSPKAILPESKTVIVGAIHITDTWTEMGGEPEPQDRSAGGWMDQNSFMDRVAYKTVRLLSERGHQAIAVASSNIWRYRDFPGIPSLFAPDLSHIHAATAAGLAEIGWSGLAITPEFGSRCRFISIVTDADLVPTPMYSGPALCDRCMDCVRTCPSAALRKDMNSSKPHRVEIGGRVFEYANKNIWRCAWAEHFNLDLNSRNLKEWDHIGEAEILLELREKGTRNHERGVCQKYCVPPHLRSKEPSFGRTDKLITQNRILRRYPENMPTLRKMRDDITAYAARFGIDVTAVAPLDPNTESGKLALSDAPGMCTVIALAMQIPEEVAKAANTESSLLDTYKYGSGFKMLDPYRYGYGFKLHHILLRVARMVEDYGYHAASYTGSLPPLKNEATGFAVMAGLGTCDDHGHFTMPEFGENVFIGAVVTNAPLDPTPAGKGTAVVSSHPVKQTPKKLRSDLERLAGDNLVSLFGVAPVQRFDSIVEDLKRQVDEKQLGEAVVDKNPDYHGVYKPEVVIEPKKIQHPRDYMPEAKSVIVLGMNFPEALVKNAGLPETQQIGPYAFHQYQTAFELRFAACELASSLAKQGYKTYISENMLGIGSLVDSHRGFLPDARCNAIEAVAAGLGQLGKSGSLLTPEFGAHQRQIVIITDAELPADGLYQGESPCQDCKICVDLCPMDALGGDAIALRIDGKVLTIPTVNRHRCDWSKKYALCSEEGPALIGNKTNVAKPEGMVTIETIAEAITGRDPIMKRRPCILETCLHKCPAGAH